MFETSLRTLCRDWLNGTFVEHFEYDIAGTACAPVVEAKRPVHIPDRLLELYPGDPDIRAINAVSYLGVPLLDPQGEVMGHLSVLDNKPLPAAPRLISLFDVFAARAAAEQRRLRQEMEARAREEELTALLDSAMDAEVVLEATARITRVNPAAEKLFGCTTEDLVGGNVRELQNSIARGIILATGGRLDLQRALLAASTPILPATGPVDGAGARSFSAAELESLERANIERALAVAGGKISGNGGAAELLGLPPSTVTSRMKALGIQRTATKERRRVRRHAPACLFRMPRHTTRSFPVRGYFGQIAPRSQLHR